MQISVSTIRPAMLSILSKNSEIQKNCFTLCHGYIYTHALKGSVPVKHIGQEIDFRSEFEVPKLEVKGLKSYVDN